MAATKPMQWTTLGEYIEKRRKDLLLSRRALARELGMSATHLSGIVQGKTQAGAEVCNRISDYFHDPQAIALRLAGWLKDAEPADADEVIREFSLSIRDDPDLRAIVDAYWKVETPSERRAMARFILETFSKK
jgi:transcriptional regulator with XRE-family HTH domain